MGTSYRGCQRPFLPAEFDPLKDSRTVSTDFPSSSDSEPYLASLSRADLEAGGKLRRFRSRPSPQSVGVFLDPWERGTSNLAEYHTVERNKRTHRVTLPSLGNSPKLCRLVFHYHRIEMWFAKRGRLPKYLGAAVGPGSSTFWSGPKGHRLGPGALVARAGPLTKRPRPRWWVYYRGMAPDR